MIVRAFLIAAICCVAAAIPAAAQTAALPDELEQLLAATEAGATPALLTRADTYVAAHPNDGDGYAVRCEIDASLAMQQNTDNSQAMADCQKGMTLSPQSAFTFYAAADVLYDAGKFQDSLTQYSRAVSLGMADRGIFWKRCDAYRRTGDLDAALRDCLRQISLTPDVFEARYALGRLQVARNDDAAGVHNLNAALEIRADDIDALYWRATAYAHQKDFKDAEADFSACIEHGDDSADTYLSRGMVRRSLGRTADALADFQEALKRYTAANDSRQIALVTAQIAYLQANAASPSPTPPLADFPFTLDGMSFTPQDVSQLLGGMHSAPGSSVHVQVNVIQKSAADMPPYDPARHYVRAVIGPDGAPQITLWIGPNLKDPNVVAGMLAGALLGLVDSGYAGPKWKQLYDRVAAQDKALGPSAADPFMNRRSLAMRLAKIYGEMKTK